ncbi:MAG: phage tail protein [Dysgonamonadaceae bacterium]|jgi:TP901-1 family phage major tail protein|nr:phage tail protein [Dysgonamonadaceae bacterium]
MPPIKHDSNTDIFRGQLFIFVGENPIAYGTNATMNIATEEIDITNKMMSGGWKGSLPGQKSFSITSESLLTQKEGQYSFDTLLDKQIKDETFDFFMGEAKVTDPTSVGGKFELDRTKKYYAGTVMITSLDLTSEVNGIATCSASFTGVGALVPGTPTT